MRPHETSVGEMLEYIEKIKVDKHCLDVSENVHCRQDAGAPFIMKTKLLFAVIFIFAFSTFVSAQKLSNEVKSSAAFAEVILRMTEIEADLEELLVSYTEEFPKVKESRYELKLLQNDLEYVAKMKASETGKLTQALGKLLVRKAQLATDYWVIKSRYNVEHPEAKKAKRKLDIFEKAIQKIL